MMSWEDPKQNESGEEESSQAHALRTQQNAHYRPFVTGDEEGDYYVKMGPPPSLDSGGASGGGGGSSGGDGVKSEVDEALMAPSYSKLLLLSLPAIANEASPYVCIALQVGDCANWGFVIVCSGVSGWPPLRTRC